MSSTTRNVSAPCMWKRRAYERHRTKVKQAICAIDVNPPERRRHVSLNAKGAQLEREKQDRIQRENFILLMKLRAIMERERSSEKCSRLRWDEGRCIRARR